MNAKKIEKAVRELLIGIGEDPEREGLKETPKRVAKMYAEVLHILPFPFYDESYFLSLKTLTLAFYLLITTLICSFPSLLAWHLRSKT